MVACHIWALHSQIEALQVQITIKDNSHHREENLSKNCLLITKMSIPKVDHIIRSALLAKIKLKKLRDFNKSNRNLWLWWCSRHSPKCNFSNRSHSKTLWTAAMHHKSRLKLRWIWTLVKANSSLWILMLQVLSISSNKKVKPKWCTLIHLRLIKDTLIHHKFHTISQWCQALWCLHLHLNMEVTMVILMAIKVVYFYLLLDHLCLILKWIISWMVVLIHPETWKIEVWLLIDNMVLVLEVHTVAKVTNGISLDNLLITLHSKISFKLYHLMMVNMVIALCQIFIQVEINNQLQMLRTIIISNLTIQTLMKGIQDLEMNLKMS